MNKIFICIALFISSILLIANGNILIGMYLFIATFIYFQITLLTCGEIPKPEIEVTRHISAEEFYKNQKEEKRKVRIKRVNDRRWEKWRKSHKLRFLASSYYFDRGSSNINSYASKLDANDDFYLTAIFNQGTEDIIEIPNTIHVNPSTGELMIGGVGGVDTSGNPYGFDINDIALSEDFDSNDK